MYIKMENAVCDEIKRGMQECITKNDDTHLCKELIESFDKICKKEEEDKKEEEKEVEEKEEEEEQKEEEKEQKEEDLIRELIEKC